MSRHIKCACVLAIVTMHYFLQNNLCTLQIKDSIVFEERLHATGISDGSCTTIWGAVKLYQVVVNIFGQKV